MSQMEETENPSFGQDMSPDLEKSKVTAASAVWDPSMSLYERKAALLNACVHISDSLLSF